MALRPTVLAVLCATLLSGCAVAGLFEDVPSVDAGDVAVPVAWSIPAPAGEPVPVSDPWWSLFGSQELDGLIERSRRHNPALLAGAHRIAQARARVRQAGAGLFPNLGASGSG